MTSSPAHIVVNKGLSIKFRKLHPEAKLPVAMTQGAIGMDIYAFLLAENGRRNNMLLPPRTTRNVPTGLQIEVPPGYFAAVCSRSGLAKDSLFVGNAPGIIDPDYRGELRVLLYNGGHESYYVQHEQRVAQLILLPAVYAGVTAVGTLTATERGTGGLGSTGK
jgi:dUTP pyrophosphatase